MVRRSAGTRDGRRCDSPALFGSPFSSEIVIYGYINCAGKSHETVSINHNCFTRKVSRSVESNLRPSVYQPSALPPGLSGSRSLEFSEVGSYFYSLFSGGGGRRVVGVGAGDVHANGCVERSVRTDEASPVTQSNEACFCLPFVWTLTTNIDSPSRKCILLPSIATAGRCSHDTARID